MQGALRDWEDHLRPFIDHHLAAKVEKASATKDKKPTCFGKQATIRARGVDEVQIARALSDQLGLPFLDLGNLPIPDETLAVLPRNVAQRHGAVPVTIARIQLESEGGRDASRGSGDLELGVR